MTSGAGDIVTDDVDNPESCGRSANPAAYETPCQHPSGRFAQPGCALALTR